MRPGTWPLFKRRVHYIFSFHLQWLAVVLLVASVVIVTMAPKEVCIRWWGMVLQLIGVYAVVRELMLAQAKHGLGFGQWRAKVKEGWPTTVHHAHAGDTVRFSDNATSAVVRGHAPSVLTGEELIRRMSILEGNYEAMARDVGRVNAQLADLSSLIEHEAALREQAIAQLEADARASDEVRLPFSLFGVACLFVGVILGTGSGEIHKWLH
jgi:hypothetical protein